MEGNSSPASVPREGQGQWGAWPTQYGPRISTGMVPVTPDNTGSSYHRTMDPGMALGNNPGLEDTMAPSVSAGHLDQHDSGGGMTPGHPHDHRF